MVGAEALVEAHAVVARLAARPVVTSVQLLMMMHVTLVVSRSFLGSPPPTLRPISGFPPPLKPRSKRAAGLAGGGAPRGGGGGRAKT